MNDSWRQADAEAHEAKSDAIANAMTALDGLDGMLDPTAVRLIEQVQQVLAHERDAHDKAAKLAAA